MESRMKTILAILAFAFVLAGCNTVRGAGQDIQRAGEKIEDAAKKK
jgi:predicted small secreted protein